MSGEDARAARLARLLKVQSQKRAVAEWRLAELRRDAAAIDARDREIVESLNGEGPLHGLFLDARVNALRRNERERTLNLSRQDGAQTRLKREARIEKGVETAADEAAAAARAAGEKRDLLIGLDRLAGIGKP